MHKKYYEPNTEFFVVYATHEKNDSNFKLVSIDNITLGLYDFLKEKEEKGECSTNGEIAQELLGVLKDYLLIKHSSINKVALINWYEI